MPGDERLTSIGVEDLGVIGIFVFLSVVALGIPGVNFIGLPGKLSCWIPGKVVFWVLLDPCSLYSALIHLDINRIFNQDSAIALIDL